MRVDGLRDGDLQMMVAPELNEQRRLAMIAYSQVRERLSDDGVVSAAVDRHVDSNAGLRLGGPVLGSRYGVFAGGHNRPLPTPQPPTPPPVRFNGIKAEEASVEGASSNPARPYGWSAPQPPVPEASDSEADGDGSDSEEDDEGLKEAATRARLESEELIPDPAPKRAGAACALSIPIDSARRDTQVQHEAKRLFSKFGFVRAEQRSTRRSGSQPSATLKGSAPRSGRLCYERKMPWSNFWDVGRGRVATVCEDRSAAQLLGPGRPIIDRGRSPLALILPPL